MSDYIGLIKDEIFLVHYNAWVGHESRLQFDMHWSNHVQD